MKNRYIDDFDSSYYGNITCPIGEKNLGDRQWMKILTNNKLNRTESLNCNESKGMFIRSHIDEFSRSFRDFVSSNPERFINLVLQCDTGINEIFIDSLFNGVAFSNKLNEVSTYLLEKIILKYRYNYDSPRASCICSIIERKEKIEWSNDILDILNGIAINQSNPCNEKPNVTSYKDKEMKSFSMLHSNAINCTRGNAAIAIGNLLWNNKKLYVQFKETVLKLCVDTNAVVRLANLSALSPIYNIDRDWATEKIIETFEGDYRIAGYSNAKQLFFLNIP